MSSTTAGTQSYYVPDSLMYYAKRLNFSKNRVRLQTLSSQTVAPNGQIIVRLPSNTLLNFPSLAMSGSFRAQCQNSGATDGCAPPTNLDFSMFESASVISNGGVINQPFLGYDVLGNILNDAMGGQDSVKKRSALQHSIPQPLIKSDTTNGDELSGYIPFVVSQFISPTQSMEPSYISSNLLGDVEVRIVMKGREIVQTGTLAQGEDNAGTAGMSGTWDIKNLNFYIETAQVESAILDQAISDQLASGMPMVVPFCNVFSFSQTNADSTFNQRFSVSSNCINKIIGTTQINTLLNPPANDVKFVDGIPSTQVRSSNGVRFSQFSVNNIYSPNYQIDSELTDGSNWVGSATNGALAIENLQASNSLLETRAALDIDDYNYETVDALCTLTQPPFELLGGGVYNDGATKVVQPPSEGLIATQADGTVGDKSENSRWVPYEYKTPINVFLEDKYVVATSFDLNTDSKDRCSTGLNTLGSNAQMFWQSTGTGGTQNTSRVYVMCTSQIEIYAGASLSIIQ